MKTKTMIYLNCFLLLFSFMKLTTESQRRDSVVSFPRSWLYSLLQTNGTFLFKMNSSNLTSHIFPPIKSISTNIAFLFKTNS